MTDAGWHRGAIALAAAAIQDRRNERLKNGEVSSVHSEDLLVNATLQALRAPIGLVGVMMELSALLSSQLSSQPEDSDLAIQVLELRSVLHELMLTLEQQKAEAS